MTLNRNTTLLTISLLLAAACGDDDGPAPDAGVTPDSAAAPDSAPADGGPAPDSGAADAGGCANLAGTYAVSGGTCSSSDTPAMRTLCVWQPSSGCAATLGANNQWQGLSGSVKGGTLEAKNSAKTQTCTLSGSGSSLSITCQGGQGLSCTGTATKLSVSSASATCCDPFAQNCPSKGDRCTMITTAVSSATFVTTGCIPRAGSKKRHEACSRTGQGPGFDDCGPGLYCSNWGSSSPSSRRCLPFCTGSSQCQTGEACLLMGWTTTGNVSPWLGTCVATCDLVTGKTCPAGLECRINTDAELTASGKNLVRGFCTHSEGGAGKEGASCAAGNQCLLGLGCIGSTCKRFCHLSKPACSAGKTCKQISNTVPGLDLGACS